MPPDIAYPTNIKITSRGTLRARQVTLQHVKTGRIVTAPSVAAFARRMKWGPNGPQHFDNVLKGNRLVHRGWGVPTLLNQTLDLKDVFGNRYSATIAEIVNKVGSATANKLRRQGSCGALVLADRDLSNVLTPKTYRVDGYLFRAGYTRERGTPLVRLTHLKEAPDRLGISLNAAFRLAHGYAISVRGVTFLKAYTTKRRATEVLETVEG